MTEFFERLEFNLDIDPEKTQRGAELLVELKEFALSNGIFILPKHWVKEKRRSDKFDRLIYALLIPVALLILIWLVRPSIISYSISLLVRLLLNPFGALAFLLILILPAMGVVYGYSYLSYIAHQVEVYRIRFRTRDNSELDRALRLQVHQRMIDYLDAIGLELDNFAFSAYGVEGAVGQDEGDVIIRYWGERFDTEALTSFLRDQFLKYLFKQIEERLGELDEMISDRMEKHELTEEQTTKLHKMRERIHTFQDPPQEWHLHRRWGIIANYRRAPLTILRSYILFMGDTMKIASLMGSVFLIVLVVGLWLQSDYPQVYAILLLIPVLIIWALFFRFGLSVKPLRIDIKYYRDGHMENIHWQYTLRQILAIYGASTHTQRSEQLDHGITVQWPEFVNYLQTPSFYLHGFYHFSAILILPRSMYRKISEEVYSALSSMEHIPTQTEVYAELTGTSDPEKENSHSAGYEAHERHQSYVDIRKGKYSLVGGSVVVMIFLMFLLLASMMLALAAYPEVQDMQVSTVDTIPQAPGYHITTYPIGQTGRYVIQYTSFNESLGVFTVDFAYSRGDALLFHNQGLRYNSGKDSLTFEDIYFFEKGQTLIIESNSTLPTEVRIYAGVPFNPDSFFFTPIIWLVFYLSSLYWLYSNKYIYRRYSYIPSLYRNYLEQQGIDPEADIVPPDPPAGKMDYLISILTIGAITVLVLFGADEGFVPMVEYRYLHVYKYMPLVFTTILLAFQLSFRKLGRYHDFTGKHRRFKIGSYMLFLTAYCVLIHPGVIAYIQFYLKFFTGLL